MSPRNRGRKNKKTSPGVSNPLDSPNNESSPSTASTNLHQSQPTTTNLHSLSDGASSTGQPPTFSRPLHTSNTHRPSLIPRPPVSSTSRYTSGHTTLQPVTNTTPVLPSRTPSPIQPHPQPLQLDDESKSVTSDNSSVDPTETQAPLSSHPVPMSGETHHRGSPRHPTWPTRFFHQVDIGQLYRSNGHILNSPRRSNRETR